MKRRSLLRGSLVASAALGCSRSPATLGTADSRDPKLERVKRAMLSMQRASWEQGVAAQACLAQGDDDSDSGLHGVTPNVRCVAPGYHSE